MPVIATVGGLDSNSYNTVVGISALLAERAGAGTTWTESTDQVAIAITATNRLEQEEYEGYKTEYTQALQFPRVDIYDRSGTLYASDAMPKPILVAHAELCLQLARDPELLDDTGLEAFDSANVGELNISNKSSFRPGQLPANIARTIGHLLAGSNGVELISG